MCDPRWALIAYYGASANLPLCFWFGMAYMAVKSAREQTGLQLAEGRYPIPARPLILPAPLWDPT